MLKLIELLLLSNTRISELIPVHWEAVRERWREDHGKETELTWEAMTLCKQRAVNSWVDNFEEMSEDNQYVEIMELAETAAELVTKYEGHIVA